MKQTLEKRNEKQIDIGMKWPIVDINSICRPKQWKTLSMDKLTDTGFPVYGANGKIGFFSEYTHANPTLAITCRGATCGNVHITEPMSYINGNAMALDNLSKDIDIRFLYYYFLQRGFNDVISGSAQPQITGEGLSKVQIPLPPLPIQKRIAEILDAADALRKKDQELLKKYDELAQAIFIDMFGDPVKNEKGWEKVKMGNLMTIVRGGSPRPIEKYLGGNFPWIKIGDATKGDEIYLNATKEHIIKEGLSKTRLLPAGSLIFANCGVSLGFARIITFEGCIHDGWLAFSEFDNSKLNKIFLLKALNSITEYFRNSAPEGTQPNLNTAIMKDFELIIPPIEHQNAFEEIINCLKLNKNITASNSEKSTDLFLTIISSAFSGELVS
jgi:type I restriction enzyme S subunit